MFLTSTIASQSALEKRRNGSDWLTRTLKRALALGAAMWSASTPQNAELIRYLAPIFVDVCGIVASTELRMSCTFSENGVLVRNARDPSIAPSSEGSQYAVATVYSTVVRRYPGICCVSPTPHPRASMSPALPTK